MGVVCRCQERSSWRRWLLRRVPRWTEQNLKGAGDSLVQGMWRESAPEALGVSCSQCSLCPGKALGRPGARCAGGGSQEGLRVQSAAGRQEVAQGSEEGAWPQRVDPCVTQDVSRPSPGPARPSLTRGFGRDQPFFLSSWKRPEGHLGSWR